MKSDRNKFLDKQTAGQALVEFALCSIIACIATVGAAWSVADAWNRAECAYLVFETTHARLTGRFAPQSNRLIQIHDMENQISGEAQCGRLREKCGSSKTGVCSMVKGTPNSRLGMGGSLQVPLLMAILVVTLSGFGVWGYLRHWRFLVQTQLRLDQCIGKAALEFKDKLNTLIQLNGQMVALRAAVAVAEVSEPAAVPPLKLALGILVHQQDGMIALWRLKKLQWLTSRGCGRSDFPLPLPDFEYLRGPPDSLGPQVLSWRGEMPSSFHFQINHSPRAAAARVRRSSNEESVEAFIVSGHWNAVWSAPRSFGASFH